MKTFFSISHKTYRSMDNVSWGKMKRDFVLVLYVHRSRWMCFSVCVFNFYVYYIFIQKDIHIYFVIVLIWFKYWCVMYNIGHLKIHHKFIIIIINWCTILYFTVVSNSIVHKRKIVFTWSLCIYLLLAVQHNVWRTAITYLWCRLCMCSVKGFGH